MTNILALDTTSRLPTVSLSLDGKIILEHRFPAHDELSASLIPTLESVLSPHGLSIADIEVFGIGVGPGLFTGIRVGLATLKGLMFSNPRPVVPVVMLEALVYKFGEEGLEIFPMIDARRDEVYLAKYRAGDPCRELLSPRLVHVKDLRRELDGENKLNFVGSGAEAHREFLLREFPSAVILPASTIPAVDILGIARREFAKKNYILDLQELLPLYIRKPDAELNYREKKK